MIQWIGKMIDRIFAVAGAIAFAQFPQFFLQYLHQLSGHAAELQIQLEQLKQSVKLSNSSITELIAKFHLSLDPDIVRLGDFMQMIVDRSERFTTALSSLQNASIFTKPFLFIRYFDSSIGRDTFKHFQLGFSFTLEGIVYAFVGMVFGYYVFYSLRSVVLYAGRSLKRV